MLLIIIGGIGFTIWNEVRTKKLKFSRYSLHAKIVISTTLILVFGGGLFMYIFEKSNTIAGMDTPVPYLHRYSAQLRRERQASIQ